MNTLKRMKKKCVPPVNTEKVDGDCHIVVFDYEGQTITKCRQYKKDERLDLCMKTHCNMCRNYRKCFPDERGGNNGREQNR